MLSIGLSSFLRIELLIAEGWAQASQHLFIFSAQRKAEKSNFLLKIVPYCYLSELRSSDKYGFIGACGRSDFVR